MLWSIDQSWLDSALVNTEASARGSGSVDVSLSKDGRQVIVKGRIKAPLTMPCARTLDPVDVDVDAELLLMLSPAPAPVREPPVRTSKKRKTSKAEPGSAKDSGRLAKERVLSDLDAAQDFYSGDEIVLDEFVREFIVLELPMFPLRSDLREVDNPAIPGPPEQASDGSGKRIDPRLAPLAKIAGRLKYDTKE